MGLAFCACNNFFHDLFLPDDNLITSFKITGQIGAEEIGPDTVDIIVAQGTDLSAVKPRISVSEKASLLPLTLDYVSSAFPSADPEQTAEEICTTDDLHQYVGDLIRENHNFKVPALLQPIDFTDPVSFLVIGGQGGMRRYTVNVGTDD
jgi:hypothetical protein